MKAPIFLFGSGRCGSTLVQRAINAHPEIVMYGEHEGFLGPVANSYHKLMRTKDVDRFVFGDEAVDPELIQGAIKDSNVDICWINNFTRDDVVREHRSLVLNLLAKGLDLDAVHWGFKEIRYRKGQHTLWFLREMFPECKFIILLRHPLDTIVSGFLAWEDSRALLQQEQKIQTMAKNRIDGWNEKYGYLMNHARENPEGLLIVKYEELISNPQVWMDQIFGLLGLETPALALDMFGHRVASTSENPLRLELSQIVQDAITSTSNDEFKQLAGELNYV